LDPKWKKLFVKFAKEKHITKVIYLNTIDGNVHMSNAHTGVLVAVTDQIAVI
jgi:hypothetical protein